MPNSNFLPEGVFDYLPADAERMELLRRRVVDIFHSWGYRLVIPPMMEFLSTLVPAGGQDADKDTLKLIDQISGRLIGIRSDITPQATRIDANHNQGGVNRLCYVGETLTTLPKGADRTRIPIQVGAEIFGADSALADAEVLLLVHELFERLQIDDYHLELSDARILNRLCAAIGFPAAHYPALSEALSMKSVSGLQTLLDPCIDDPEQRAWITALLDLNGEIDSVLERARQTLPPDIVADALADMEHIVSLVRPMFPAGRLVCDLAESTGHQYYTGISFAVYASGHAKDLLRGGRYRLDTGYSNVSNREAVGFSTDMQTLMRLSPLTTPAGVVETEVGAVFDPQAFTDIQRRRAQGERISYRLD